MSRATNEALHGLVMRVAIVWQTFDRAEGALRQKLLGGNAGPLEREAFEDRYSALVAERDRQLARLHDEAGRASVTGEQEFRSAMRRDMPPRQDEIDAAWRGRVEPMLKAG